MNKEQFLAAVGARIGALPPEDIARSLDYYREMIDDRIEDGMTEYEAVAAMGTVEEVVAEILAGSWQTAPPPPPPAWEPEYEPERVRRRPRRRLPGGVIALLVLGSPVWLPLAFAGLIVVVSLLFALIVTVLGLAVGGIVAIVGGVGAVFTHGLSHAALAVGAGLVLTGVAMLLEQVAKKAAVGAFSLGRKTRRWIWGRRR